MTLQVVRGDWFVTSGDELSAIVMVTDPTGNEVYREGPTRQTWREDGEGEEPASEGSFRFVCEMEGILRLVVTNPSSEDPRTVTLAWLKGRDDDDPYTAGPGEGWDFATEDPHADALIANPRNASAYVRTMLGRVSSLHKKIDELVSQQQYMDVLFKRHLGVAEKVNRRVVRFTLLESAAIVVVAIVQVVIIRRFDMKPPGYHTWV